MATPTNISLSDIKLLEKEFNILTKDIHDNNKFFTGNGSYTTNWESNWNIEPTVTVYDSQTQQIKKLSEQVARLKDRLSYLELDDDLEFAYQELKNLGDQYRHKLKQIQVTEIIHIK
jgi:hypothetical protein